MVIFRFGPDDDGADFQVLTCNDDDDNDDGLVGGI